MLSTGLCEPMNIYFFLKEGLSAETNPQSMLQIIMWKYTTILIPNANGGWDQ